MGSGTIFHPTRATVMKFDALHEIVLLLWNGEGTVYANYVNILQTQFEKLS